MKTITAKIYTAFFNLKALPRFVFRLGKLLFRFAWFMLQPKAFLAAKLLATESQLVACVDAIKRRKAPRPKFDAAFRVLWITLSKCYADWKELAHVMQPATVVKWHRQAFKRYWRWKSNPGRPPVSTETQMLIRRMSRENVLWSAERIHLELQKLGFAAPCADTVAKYMQKSGKPRKPSGTWLPFLRNHLDVSWAMDFFTVTTLTFDTLYVFLILEHGRRRVRMWATTYAPSMPWVIQQLRNATPWDEHPCYLHRDNDGIYGKGVPVFLKSCGIEEVRIAYRCPWQNPYVERFIGTLRRELLDHVIIVNQAHLERLLKEFIEDYYHIQRPHQGLEGDTPLPRPKRKTIKFPTKVISTPVVGGLHHSYERVAA